METRNRLVLTGAVVLALAGIVLANPVLSDEKAPTLQQRVVGTWILTDLYADAWDGDDRNPFGSDPKGRMILDVTGHVALLIIGGDRIKFLLGDRLAGTADENKAAVQSTQAFYGTYSVTEKDHALVFHIERSSFPNWDGTDQLSTITMNGDELRQTKPGPHNSHGSATWKRVGGVQVAQER